MPNIDLGSELIDRVTSEALGERAVERLQNIGSSLQTSVEVIMYRYRADLSFTND